MHSRSILGLNHWLGEVIEEKDHCVMQWIQYVVQNGCIMDVKAIN